MLKPVDIQNHTLKTSMSGYNKKETDEFLASVHESYESVLRENRDLKDKITSLSEGIQYYKQMENTLQKALVLAEKTSSETQEAAKVQADAMIKDAQEKADEIIKDAQEKADGIIKGVQEEADRIIEDAKTETGSIKSEADAFVKESEAKAGTLIKDAQKKAETVINKAENEALSIKSAAQQECDNINAKSVQLLQNYENYRGKLKKFALAQLEMLENGEFILHVPELEDTSNAVEEKFSWNSDEYAAVQTPENESANGFTFIDTE